MPFGSRLHVQRFCNDPSATKRLPVSLVVVCWFVLISEHSLALMAESSTGASERPSPSRSWFAASRVEERVRDLEAKMDLVHVYGFATAPRDIQKNMMAIDNLTSRLDGLASTVADVADTTEANIRSAVEQIRGSHTPQQTETTPAGESQHGSVEQDQDPLKILDKYLDRFADRLHRVEQDVAGQADRADLQLASMEIQRDVLNIVSHKIGDVQGLHPRIAQLVDEI